MMVPILNSVLQRVSRFNVISLDKFRRQYSVYLPNAHKTVGNKDGGLRNKRSSSGSGPKSVEIDQLGAWNTRINFGLSEEQSIRRGTPIPILKTDQVGICSNRGRRAYQVIICITCSQG
jgi:hypothetical protein